MRCLISLPLAVLAGPVLAQETAPPIASVAAATQTTQDDEEAAAPVAVGGSNITVVGSRYRGQIDAPQPAVATFDEKDIQALGAGSIGELLTRIAPQTGSGRGRGGGGMPVILVNGQRITNFREMRNFPPEAIRRIEVLPEEVALRYGFPPDSRVVNLILKPHFRSRSMEVSHGVPTLGGFGVTAGEATLTRIEGPSRLTATASADHTTPLFESERPLVQPAANQPSVASDPSPAAYRSLIGDTRNYGLNLAWTKGLGKDGLGGAISLNGNVARADGHGWQGLDLVRLVDPGNAVAIRALPNPLERASHTTTLQAGAGYNGYLGGWQLSATLDASHGESVTMTDRRADTSSLVTAAAAGTLPITGALPVLADAGADRASSVTDGATSLLTLVGHPLRLPGGEAALTLKTGYAWSGIRSDDSRTLIASSLHRGDFSIGVNLALPLTSKREHFGGALGDLTLNLSAGWDHLSDFGSLTDWSAGLTWGLTDKLNLQASYIVNQAAPSLANLGAPLVQSFNVPVYDFTRGETALVTVTSGGNPNLRREEQRDLKLGLNWTLPVIANSNLVVEYFRNRSNEVTASFPVLTPDIEAAFPTRVVRSGAGHLLSIDQRPITFAEQTGSRLRWGVNLTGGFGKAADGGGMAAMFGGGGPRGGGGSRPGGGGARPGGGGRGGGMGMMMGGPGGKPGRWSLGLFHTVQFTSRVLVAPGGPVLDLLNGDALTSGGTPRHSLEFNGGVFYKGFGLFSQGTWQAPTTVAASGLPGTSDLRFGSLAKVNLFLFTDFNMRPKLVKQVPLLKGVRMSLRFENVLNARQRVSDANGLVPLSYQLDYLDPRGRVITLELRKMF